MSEYKKEQYIKERSIREDNVFITEMLNDLPKDNAFYRLIKHQLFFYADKAHKYKRWCCFLSVLTVILPAIVTSIGAMSTITPFCCKLAITLLSAISSVSAGVIGVFNLREQWISYRMSCEKLKLEVSKFLSKTEPYNKEESINEGIFVKNCEMIFENEGNKWVGNTRFNSDNG